MLAGGANLDVIVPAAPPMPFTSGGQARNFSVAGQQVQFYVDGELRLCAGVPMGTEGSILVSVVGYLIAKP